MDIWSLKEPPRYQNSHIRIKELLIANPTVFDRTAYDFLERIRLIVEIFNGSPPVQEIQTRVGNNCDYSPEKPSGTYSNNKEEYVQANNARGSVLKAFPKPVAIDVIAEAIETRRAIISTA